jgi:nucleotide-binding universal stress UspA family protein
MYRNILVPISFDTERDTQGALDVARALVAEGGSVRLLHILESIPAYVETQIPPAVLQEAEQSAQARLDALAATVPGGSAQVIHGHSGRTIIDYVAANGTDLVIIASHRPGMQNLLLGSTATQVVRHVACAVHVLR